MKPISSIEINKELVGTYIPRSIHPELVLALHKPEVTILYGPRQVGKSFEVWQLIRELAFAEPQTDIFYFNLDRQNFELEDPEKFWAEVIATKNFFDGKSYIFIDEAQRFAGLGLFIKYLYDKHENVKFFLTGSASLEIKQKIKEPLTGRKQDFFLSPLSLKEILRYKGVKNFPLQADLNILQAVLEEYLLFGGYPGVVTLGGQAQKREKLLEISRTYLLKDLSEYFSGVDAASLELVAVYLAENTGQILSKDNLSNFTGVAKYKVEKILAVLNMGFVTGLLLPFSKNKAKELTHRPKVYFYDPGIRNAILGKLTVVSIVSDRGKLFENAVYLLLKNKYRKVNFWRTHNQTEVDFLAFDNDNLALACEAKFSANPESAGKNLLSLQKQYPDVVKSVQIISRENLYKFI